MANDYYYGLTVFLFRFVMQKIEYCHKSLKKIETEKEGIGHVSFISTLDLVGKIAPNKVILSQTIDFVIYMYFYYICVHSFKENKFENAISGSILRKCVENPAPLDFSFVRIISYVSI